MALQTGSLLNERYRIEDVIAIGGMGAVYRALDENLGIRVAVKENFFTTEEFSRQFRREATILAGLRHPNLPRVTDHFVIPGQGQYLVMDYIEGRDLRDMIGAANNLNLPDIIRIGVTVCDALDYLHTRTPAIVHRDIKPGNLKVTPSQKIYLVDFGLAKLAHGEATTIGAQALTPGYAPPEQYGQGTEPRSDIYALGATLYVFLTGKVPEDGLSRAMGMAHLTPIRKHNPQVPESVARVIEKAMAVHAEDRYQSAAEFKQALMGAIPNLDPTLPIAPLEKPALQQPTIPAAARPGRAAPPAAEKETAASRPAPSPRKKARRALPLLIIFAALIVVCAGTLAALLGPGMPAVFQPFPSPMPAITEQTDLTAESETTATETAAPAAAAATPSLTAAAPSPSPTSPPATQTPPPEASAPPPPAATPAGGGPGQIAFSSNRSGTVQIWLANLDGSGLKQVTNLADGACQPDWSPDGQRLVFVSPCSGLQDDYPGASLYLIGADGTGLVPLVTLPGGDYEPAWSPDGGQIAFTSLRDNGVPHIYLYNLADHTATRLSRPVNHERQPAWSPDGRRLAYQTTRLGEPQIWVMSADGEDAREFSTLAGGFEWMPVWSPDGSIIVFSKGNPPLLTARQFGERLAREFPVSERVFPAEMADFSPDGWWLIFEMRKQGQIGLFRMQRNGSSLTTLLADDPYLNFHPAWRPDVSP